MACVDEYAKALADGIEAALPGWVERSVLTTLDRQGVVAGSAVVDDAVAAGRLARDDVGAAVRDLLARDLDDQPTTPLSLLRAAVQYPTGVLQRAAAAPVARERFDVERFPDDPYGLTPATFADIDAELAALGFAWGAWKAKEHKARHGGTSA